MFGQLILFHNLKIKRSMTEYTRHNPHLDFFVNETYRKMDADKFVFSWNEEKQRRHGRKETRKETTHTKLRGFLFRPTQLQESPHFSRYVKKIVQQNLCGNNVAPDWVKRSLKYDPTDTSWKGVPDPYRKFGHVADYLMTIESANDEIMGFLVLFNKDADSTYLEIACGGGYGRFLLKMAGYVTVRIEDKKHMFMCAVKPAKARWIELGASQHTSICPCGDKLSDFDAVNTCYRMSRNIEMESEEEWHKLQKIYTDCQTKNKDNSGKCDEFTPPEIDDGYFMAMCFDPNLNPMNSNVCNKPEKIKASISRLTTSRSPTIPSPKHSIQKSTTSRSPITRSMKHSIPRSTTSRSPTTRSTKHSIQRSSKKLSSEHSATMRRSQRLKEFW
jgi:hypothetical protein